MGREVLGRDDFPKGGKHLSKSVDFRGFWKLVGSWKEGWKKAGKSREKDRKVDPGASRARWGWSYSRPRNLKRAQGCELLETLGRKETPQMSEKNFDKK
jgi:hypothetical protein